MRMHQLPLNHTRTCSYPAASSTNDEDMSENFHEAELLKALHPAIVSRRLVSLRDSSTFFARLARAYPVSGSKIDWGRVPHAIERNDEQSNVEEFVSFFDEVVDKYRLTGEVIYVGDSATDIAFASSVECVRGVLPVLLAIPQHHYLIGPETSWCMCFTMEGDMGFGFSTGCQSRL